MISYEWKWEICVNMPIIYYIIILIYYFQLVDLLRKNIVNYYIYFDPQF